VFVVAFNCEKTTTTITTMQPRKVMRPSQQQQQQQQRGCHHSYLRAHATSKIRKFTQTLLFMSIFVILFVIFHSYHHHLTCLL
jgi:hypothetical protein